MKRFSKPPLVTAICRNKEAHVWIKIWVYLSPIAAQEHSVWTVGIGGVSCVCVRKKHARYMFFLSVFKWWELVVMPWHILFKINIKHPPWQPAFLKHRYLRETKRATSFSCLYFKCLGKEISPSSDVTGDFCYSSLHRKPLALKCSHRRFWHPVLENISLDKCIFGLRLKMSIHAAVWRNLIGCLRNLSQNVTHFLNTPPQGNEGKTHTHAHVRTSAALIICLSLTLIQL